MKHLSGRIFRVCNVAAVLLLTSSILVWTTTAAAEASFSYSHYKKVLKAYVDDQGLVDYTGLKADRQSLDAFAASVAALNRQVYEKWSESQKIAFLINAYNALTLVAIVDNYPIKSSFFRGLRFPKNSIRQIPGVWDKLLFTVMGRKMTLDGIEHDILRTKFNEPRIHMALVCAALGCPILRNKPYTGTNLDEQLEDQACGLLKDPKKFRIDRKNERVYLSSIFKWFGSDFLRIYGTDKKFSGFGKAERAVLNFVSNHIQPEKRDYLEKGEYSVEYLPYDWTLNEKKR
jgi:hypothetical protein